MIDLCCVVSSLSEEGLYLLSSNIVVSLDTYIHIVVSDVGSSLDALVSTSGLPGVVDSEAELGISEQTRSELDSLS